MKNATLCLFLFATLCICGGWLTQTFPAPGPNSPYANAGNVVTIPSASPAGGSYFYVGSATTVTLSDVTGGATICYRTDGTNPAATVAGTCDAGSTTYSTGISVSTTTTIKALGTKSGMTNSSVASLTYTLSALVAEWKMADASGTTATDSCCGDNLTITPGAGGWTTLTGVANGVYNFDGVATTGTRMDAANNTNTNFNYNQPFSIFAVFQFAALGIPNNETIINNLDTAASYRGWRLEVAYLSGYYIDFLLNSTYPTNTLDVNSAGTLALTAGTLYDVLVTYDGSHTSGGVKIYVLGSSITNYSAIHTLTTTTTNAKIPRIGMMLDGTQPYKGYMGPIYIWNRVLTSGEATALHSNFYAPPN